MPASMGIFLVIREGNVLRSHEEAGPAGSNRDSVALGYEHESEVLSGSLGVLQTFSTGCCIFYLCHTTVVVPACGEQQFCVRRLVLIEFHGEAKTPMHYILWRLSRARMRQGRASLMCLPHLEPITSWSGQDTRRTPELVIR